MYAARIPLRETKKSIANEKWTLSPALQIQEILGFILDHHMRIRCVYAHYSNVSMFHSTQFDWSEWMKQSKQDPHWLYMYYYIHAYTNFVSPNHIFCCDSQHRTQPHIVHYSILSSLLMYIRHTIFRPVQQLVNAR